MFNACINSLKELSALLNTLSNRDEYTRPIRSLSQSTIGQHTRHIIELYQCLLNGYNKGEVNYDNRQRNILLETNIEAALVAIDSINANLIKPDIALRLQHNLSKNMTEISSSYYREVYYNLEHCIHHQALIKAALIELNISVVSERFGVAPSTIQYREQCAQ